MHGHLSHIILHFCVSGLKSGYFETSLLERHMLPRKGCTVQPVHVLLKCFVNTSVSDFHA